MTQLVKLTSHISDGGVYWLSKPLLRLFLIRGIRMIAYECPHCRQHMEALEGTSGLLTICDDCGAAIQVPIVLDDEEAFCEVS